VARIVSVPTRLEASDDLERSRRRRSRLVPAVGWLGFVVGHAGMMIFPAPFAAWNQDPRRLIALELALFAFGLMALASLFVVAAHRFARSQRAAPSPIDAACLGLLLVGVLSGLGIAVAHRWGSVWSSVVFTPYLRSLAELRPDLALVTAMPYLVKLHVFSAFLFVALCPFSRRAVVLSTAVRAVLARAAAPAADAVGDLAWHVAERGRASGRHLLWPEED
jgi:nitrate reductase gamma subunit